MTQRALGTTVIPSVTQIASPDGRCLMIWRRLPVQSDAGTTGQSACRGVGLEMQVIIRLLQAAGASVLVWSSGQQPGVHAPPPSARRTKY
jgi:hypothetical protein